jgi:hypothetical protein
MNKTFYFTANSGYEIDKVLIDNVNNSTAVTNGNYTFGNITANHTIDVSFKEKEVGVVGAASLPLLHIYPNPTSGKIITRHSALDAESHASKEIAGQARNDGTAARHSEQSEESIAIYDIVGRKQESRIPKIGQSEIEIDISHLSAGMYFLKVDGKVYKMIKE